MPETQSETTQTSASGELSHDRRDTLFVAVAIIGTLTLTMLPYLIGLSFAGPRTFLWLGYNLDDSCVYLSWMKQASSGSAHALNMFTTEQQHGMAMNPLFLVMGQTAHILHLPLVTVSHVFRLLFGAALLLTVWKIAICLTPDRRSRKAALLLVCFGSGVGWIPGLWGQFPAPIDSWQPEAITFLSLYLSPLFCFSLMLQALVVLNTLYALRTGTIRFSLVGGACVFLLGLTHTYDVITMLAVLFAWAVVSFGISPSSATTKRLLITAFTALLLGAPAVLYIYHQLQTEAVFHQRMEVRTASGPLYNVFLGFGLPLLFAAYYIKTNWKQYGSMVNGLKGNSASGRTNVYDICNFTTLLMGIWIVVNILVAYLPISIFPFQRKMLQGAHFPITLLGGLGLARLLSTLPLLNKQRVMQLAIAGIIGLTGISNVRFLLRDMESFEINLIQTTHMHRPYLNAGETKTLEWIDQNTPADSAIQPLPWLLATDHGFAPIDVTLACIGPSITHRKVYCGHWGETPEYKDKLDEISRLPLPDERMPEEARIALLRKMKVQYLVFSQKGRSKDDPTSDQATDQLMPMFRTGHVPNYLKLVYTNDDADVYQIVLP